MVTRNSAFVLWDEGFFICRIQEEEDMIRLEHVSKTFDSRAGNVHAVQDVTLTIQDKEIYGIIGLPANQHWYAVSICWSVQAGEQS